MRDVFVTTAARTPIGKFGGALKDFSPTDLGAHVMKAVLDKAEVSGAALDTYIMGNILRAGHGQLLPRQAAMKAGIPIEVDGYAIDMVCSSGMMAVSNAATLIKAGEADLVMAGGMESMSQTGFYLSHRARWGYKYLGTKPEPLTDILEYDALTDPMSKDLMGEQTERLSKEHQITREELDWVACESHARAQRATDNGIFAKEIAPIEVKTRKSSFVMESDEGIRPETTVEILSKLRPAFASAGEDGLLTAGNSSQINDGAAAMLIASQDAVEKHNLTPIARIVGGAQAGVESWRFVEGPVPAVTKLLEKHGLTVEDVDLFENNEAFATNSVLFNRLLGIPYDKLNIHGGGISIGHPVGASGARIIVTLLNALQHKDGQFGVASLCHGSGGGTSILLERLA